MRTLLALLAFALLLFGCASQGTQPTGTSEQKVQITENKTEEINVVAGKGDTVAVDYVGTLDNGTVFDTSIKDEAVKAKLPLRPSYSPLEFTVGAGQMIKGFDDAVVGMKEGEEKTVHLNPADAYGERQEEYVIAVPRAQAPAGVQIGSQLQATNGAIGTVVNMTNETVTIDFNHELAGKALNFRIIMRKITKG